jgi:hypothetical protein
MPSTAAGALGLDAMSTITSDEGTRSGLSGVQSLVGPEEQMLEAVYYDTADLRLARAGVTLRHRRGGDDAGWHLKLPVGADSRDEVRVGDPGDDRRRTPPTRGRPVPVSAVRSPLVGVKRVAPARLVLRRLAGRASPGPPPIEPGHRSASGRDGAFAPVAECPSAPRRAV